MDKKKLRKSLSIFLSVILFFTLFLTNSMQTFANETVKVKIHYQPGKDNEKDWNVWVWPEGKEGKTYSFTGEDKFGKYVEIEIAEGVDRVGFIVKTDSWEKDGGDRWIEIENGEGEVWVKSGDSNTYTTSPDGPEELPSYKNINLKIHYSRYDGNYNDWNLWIWPEGKEGQAVSFTEEDEYGKVANIQLESAEGIQKVGFIVRKSLAENEWAYQEFGERYITKFNKDGSAEIWLSQGMKGVYYDRDKVKNKPEIKRASIDNVNEITVETNIPFSLKEYENAGITVEGTEITEVVPYNKADGDVTNKVRIITKEPLDFTKSYTVSKEFYGSENTEIGAVVRTPEFDNAFYYEGTDLGNNYSKRKTSFRVWAPTASEVKLVTYHTWDAAEGTEVTMEKSEKGTWIAEKTGDQHGLIYTYKVKIGDTWNEAVDPYVRAVTVNGNKGVVVDLKRTNPKKWTAKKPKLKNPEDSIIYETHVRDLSIAPDSGIKNKGKFLGVAETGTTGPNRVKTGLNHIKDLGITHVQFIPIYDYATVDETKLNEPQYNWGYDPKNYNAPEGSYSTNPYEPTTRILELKKMIQTLHDNDLRMIMDVVYNHVYTVNESNFNKIVPGYFFRYNEDGTLANGTGVGNDTASERKMMRKFIVDSVTYWATEYNIDGFRFDLMGIHDVETMNEVRQALYKIDPTIIVFGEGWDLGTPLDPQQKANQKNALKMNGIGHFNDSIRDSLKGSVFEDKDNGFVNGNVTKLQQIQSGVIAEMNSGNYNDPEQVITYVEAHDNHTLWDKLLLTNNEADEITRKQMHKLASSIVLTSQGIPFIHAGQEFMRTKGGDHNSYRSPDSVNQMDWKRRVMYNDEVEYMKGLIELRKKYPALRLTTKEDIQNNVKFIDAPQQTVAYTVQQGRKKRGQLVVIHNANNESIEMKLPEEGVWKLLVNGEEAGTKSIMKVKGDSVQVSPLSTFVLVRIK
ncbi:pullulanase [Bacillus manliponensis]|uniref:pullulanase n=1 Tax=Bacillus manliponensis TaxID=574376 RepID=A0A073JT31_9BACI|nr:type I pullulanase [Bacillus manliponensis]KEK18249.1 pullulanase [Bacillus manliponensis]